MTSPSLLGSLLVPGALSVRFQPIYEVGVTRRQLRSLECLVRGPSGTNLHEADVLFEYARRKRQESLVDRAAITAIFAAARSLPLQVGLSINVHAATLCRDHEFLTFMGDAATDNGIDLTRATVEVVKHAPPWEGRSFQNALDALRHIGVAVALDDVGLGKSNYRMIVECQADFLKLDGYFVRGCHADPYRRAVVESVCHLGRKLGGRVVAEGVEEMTDLRAIVESGVGLAQGFLFQPPVTAEEVRSKLGVHDRELTPPGA